MIKIPLTQNKIAMIDDEDFGSVSAYKWHYSKNGYAATRLPRSQGGKIMPMHRLIMSCPAELMVDHANRDGLDNRRANLRLANKSQNSVNTKWVSKTSLPRGVKKRGNSFGARVRHNNIVYWIGSFGTPEEAAKAYDKEALRLHGPFTRLNYAP